jgi:hypothetical protein
MIRPPFSSPITESNGSLSRSWTEWLTKLWAQQNPKHGTTAQRPTVGINIGDPYLDETLGKPIWLKSVVPTVWIDATGASV